MIILQVQNVARHFGSDVLFEQLHMEIQSNDRIALVGRNGAGKSTLLKIIAGVEEPDEGMISKGKDVTIGYLSQDTGLDSDNTIWEEMLVPFAHLIALEQDMRDIEQRLQSIDLLENDTAYKETLHRYDQLQHTFLQENGYGYMSEIKSVLHGFSFYEDDYDRPIMQLSGGQKTRLALARLLLEKKDLLILDEPTNHLDIKTLGWLEEYLKSYSGALLIVSHDRYFLDALAEEVYEISRQKMTHYVGNYSRYLDQKAEQLERDWKVYEKQQKEMGKLEDFVNRNIVRASTTKRAQSRRKQLEKMEKLDRPQGDEKSARFHFQPAQESGQIVLQAEDVAIGYGTEPLVSQLELDIRKGEAIALVGPNGIGKSTLLKTLINKLPLLNGTIKMGTKVDIGYYDQEQEELTSSKTVLGELWDEHPTVNEKDIRSLLGSFLFSGEDVEKTVSSLSGGEKARLALSKLAMHHDNFLILDEPTNHLDLDSKEVLENALIDFDGTLLFVSHDRYFINRIATQVLELGPDGSTLYLGDYDYYVQKKADMEEVARLTEEANGTKAKKTDQVEETPTSQEDRLLTKEIQKRTRQLERQITEIEQKLDELDEQIAALDAQLATPDVYLNHEKSTDLAKQAETLKETQTTLMDKWETLSIELSEL